MLKEFSLYADDTLLISELWTINLYLVCLELEQTDWYFSSVRSFVE